MSIITREKYIEGVIKTSQHYDKSGESCNKKVAYLKGCVVGNLFDPCSQPMWTQLLQRPLNLNYHDLKAKIAQMERTLKEMKEVEREVETYLATGEVEREVATYLATRPEVVDMTKEPPEGIFGCDPKMFTLPNWMEK